MRVLAVKPSWKEAPQTQNMTDMQSVQIMQHKYQLRVLPFTGQVRGKRFLNKKNPIQRDRSGFTDMHNMAKCGNGSHFMDWMTHWKMREITVRWFVFVSKCSVIHAGCQNKKVVWTQNFKAAVCTGFLRPNIFFTFEPTNKVSLR